MERKFTQPVAMPCTSDQFKELSPALDKIGYHNEAAIGTHYGYIATNGNGKADAYICIDEDLKRDFGRYVISRFNPELFLALAAISKGPEFCPGEYVCNASTGVMYGKVTEDSHPNVQIRNFADALILVSKSSVRKATAEEIIAHFDKDSQKPGSVLKVGDSVAFKIEDCIERIGKIIDTVPDGKSFKVHVPGMGSPWIKASILERIDPSFFDQISGESDKPDVPLSEKVDKMAEDLNGMADRAEKVLESTQAFAEKMDSKWIPQPFEPIWVWNNGSDKIRHKMLFAFFSQETVFAFEEIYATWSNFTVHEWQNWAKIDAPVSVAKEDIVKHFAKAYNVPGELIQITE